ncbi:hypothetical protein MVEN_00898500 [Mycena venus]|uniref:Uncharacterized protein n=1 Tax=Mycena venus TaxID=2733690 RepID=A0A8H7D1X0_9AGAR|nr:hypothetical protein MVEN_00898500 [Mycena venus]
MPVSFPVATHPAKPFQFLQGRKGYTAVETFATACVDQHTKAGEILQFSLPVESPGNDAESGRNFEAKIPNIVPNPNGFVATVLDAYTQDRALVIRPDDVWLAILCQFNFFVNARAELLRANFVAHEGKRELVVTSAPATRYTVDFGNIARQMAGLVEKKRCRSDAACLGDAQLHDDNYQRRHCWLRHAARHAQAILQIYQHALWLRLEKLKEFGLETIAWYHLLRPVITRFVAAFDSPTRWITAFTVFNKEGQWMGHGLNTTASPETAPETLTAADFWETYGKYMCKDLVLDGTPYHRLHRGGIPPGYGEVDILVIDNGERFECAMVAGSVGTRVSSSGDLALSTSGADDTVQPIMGWWLFVKDESGMEKKAANAYGQIYGMERVRW